MRIIESNRCRMFTGMFSSSSLLTNNLTTLYKSACDYYGKENVSFIKGNPDPYVMDSNIVHPTDLKDVLENTGQLRNVAGKHPLNLCIHWDKLTVTNEHDDSVVIYDLFCSIELSFKHTFPYQGVKFMRTTYTELQWLSNYSHSHIQLDRRNPLRFSNVCLGHGPILDTMHSIINNPTEDSINLFVWELDKVAHTESLHGVPYRRMSTIQEQSAPYHLSHHDCITISPRRKQFLKSFLRAKNIPTYFGDGSVNIGCSFLQFLLILSNYYFKWSAQNDSRVFSTENITIINGILAKPQDNTYVVSPETHHGKYFTFNGVVYPFTIVDKKENRRLTVIEVQAAYDIYMIIRSLLNASYSKLFDNEHQKKEDEEQAKDRAKYLISFTGNSVATTLSESVPYAIL